jgi:hypothetical protein
MCQRPFKFHIRISESYLPPLPVAACKIVRISGFCKQMLKSKKPQKIFTHFFDIPKVETIIYIFLKSQCFTFILSVIFCANMLYTFCALYDFCAGRPYVRAKWGLFGDFSQNIFPISQPEKCTGGGVLEASQDTFLKSVKIATANMVHPPNF